MAIVSSQGLLGFGEKWLSATSGRSNVLILIKVIFTFSVVVATSKPWIELAVDVMLFVELLLLLLLLLL